MQNKVLFVFIMFAEIRLSIGICDGDKWFCMDYIPVAKCRHCDPNYLSPTIGNEFLNYINKVVCLSNILQKPCVKGCIAPKTYCNVMYKSLIPEGNFNVSLKMDISVHLMNRKHSQFLSGFGICEKVRRTPHCLFNAKVDAGQNFESLSLCINVCAPERTCNPFRHSNYCQSKFEVPLEYTIQHQDVVGIILTLDLSTFKVYVCVTTESKQSIKEVKCIAQVDFKLLQGLIKTKSLLKNDLFFLVHHYDDTYFNFNSNYLSIDSIYIYKDNIANRLRLPKVSKTIRQANKLAKDFAEVGSELCTSRHRKYCNFPSRCAGEINRCKVSSTYSTTYLTTFSSNQHYLSFESPGSSILSSVVIAFNGTTKYSINIVSIDQEIIESIIVKDISSRQNKRKIRLHFNEHHHEFSFQQPSNVLFSIKIQNTIGYNCQQEQPPIVYFANERGLTSLGKLSTSAKQWHGLFIDGLKEPLKVEDAYLESVCSTSLTKYAVAISLSIMCMSIIIGLISITTFKQRKICIFSNIMRKVNMVTHSNNSASDESHVYDIESSQYIGSQNEQLSTVLSNDRLDHLIEDISLSLSAESNERGLVSVDAISNKWEDTLNGLETHQSDSTNHHDFVRSEVDHEMEVLTCIRNLYYDALSL